MKVEKQSFIKRFNLLPKLLCVLFAFIIWLYVMAVESPDHEETIYQVPVSLVGVSTIESNYNLTVFSGYDATVDVTVKGQKSNIKKYNAEDITITADVSSFTTGGRYTVNLFFDMPSGIERASSSTETLTLYIDEKANATVNVKPRLTSVTIPEDCELGELTVDTDSIVVSGPRLLVDEIDSAVVNIDAGNLTSSVTKVGKLTLVNLSGQDLTSPYFKLSKSEVKATIPIYTYKEVPIKVPSKYGFYNESNVNITVSPEKVKLKADPAVLEKITSVNTNAIDEKKVSSDSSMILKIEVPENVTLAEGEKESVSVNVVHKGTITKKLVSKNITVVGADNINYEILSPSVSVTLRGAQDAIENLKNENVVVVVDLTGYKQTTGILYASASVQVQDESKTIYAIGDYSVQVRVN